MRPYLMVIFASATTDSRGDSTSERMSSDPLRERMIDTVASDFRTPARRPSAWHIGALHAAATVGSC